MLRISMIIAYLLMALTAQAEPNKLWTLKPSMSKDSYARIRVGPDLNAKIIGKLKPGEVVQIFPRKTIGEFYRVEFNNGYSRGFIAKRLLVPVFNESSQGSNINDLNRLTALLGAGE